MILSDAVAHDFGLQCSFLRLVRKTTHSFACKTNRIVAGVLQSIEIITYAWSVSALSQSALFEPKTFSYRTYIAIGVTCRNTPLNDSDDRCFISQTYFHYHCYCVSLCVQLVT